MAAAGAGLPPGWEAVPSGDEFYYWNRSRLRACACVHARWRAALCGADALYCLCPSFRARGAGSRLRAPQDGPRAPFQERARGMLMKLPCVCVYRLRRITNETTWEKPVVKQPPPGVHA